MEKHVENAFSWTLLLQVNLGLRAASDLMLAVREMRESAEPIWYATQALLIAAGNISKVFWPGSAYAERGLYLRERFGITDASPLADRGLRNHFEHFDERLEKWAASGDTNIVDGNVGPAGAEEMFGGIASSIGILRHFNTSTFEVSFWDERYRLGPIVDELRELSKRIHRPETTIDIVEG